MKKVIRKSLVLAVMFSAMVSYANGFVYTNNEKGEITNVTFNDVTEGSILIIKDINGLILYKETIKAQGNYSKKFDLTALPDGNYLFELDKEFEIKVIPFSVNLNEVVFDKSVESVVFKPSIISKNGLVKIHKAILNKKSLYVKFYYENGDLVYAEKFENKQIFSKTYDFSTSLKGKYRVVLSTEDRTFVENVKI